MQNKISAIWTTFKTQLSDIWNRSKVFILAIVGLILALEFQRLKESLLVWMGERQIKSATKQDTTLAATEKKDSQAADVLVAQAQELPSQEQPVTEDWYKKDPK